MGVFWINKKSKIAINAILLVIYLTTMVQAGVNQARANLKILGTVGQCQKSAGVSDEDIAELMKEDGNPNEATKCVADCIVKAFGVVNDSGDFVDEGALRIGELFGDSADQKIGKQIIKSCKAINGKDTCDRAHNLILCGKKFVGNLL